MIELPFCFSIITVIEYLEVLRISFAYAPVRRDANDPRKKPALRT